MKFTCERNSLLNGVNIALKAVSVKTTLPILECMLLKIYEGNLFIISNDLELGIKSSPVTVESEGEFSVAVDARLFSDIIRKINSDEITIECDSKLLITIKGGKSRFNIMGLSSDEFPLLPDVDKSNFYTISQNSLKNMIRQTIFSVSLDDSRPVLKGELIEIRNGDIEMVAVDGYRISYRTEKLKESSELLRAVVPAKTLGEISKILEDTDDECLLYFTDKHVLFDINGNVVVSRLVEGNFIKYEQSFSSEFKTEIIAGKAELLDSFDRASLISKDTRKTPVFMEIRDNLLIVTSKNEIGDTYEEINIEKIGDNLSIGFNSRYLTDALRAIDDEKVALHFTTSLSPLIINSCDESDKSYKYLILPLRI